MHWHAKEFLTPTLLVGPLGVLSKVVGYTQRHYPIVAHPYVRVGFWQNGFFADFYFWAAGFLRGFCRRIFSLHFCGEKVPRKILQEIPGKILQILYDKNPRQLSAEGPGQHIPDMVTGGRTAPARRLFKEVAPFIWFVSVGSSARTRFSQTHVS